MKKFLLPIILIVISISSFSQNAPTKVHRKFIDRTPGYSKSVSVSANGITTIYISGLTGEGKTFEEQTRNAFKHIEEELEASYTNFNHIVKMNTYIVNLNKEEVDSFRAIRKEFFGIKDPANEKDGMPASTIIGISALAEKDKLIEIEAVVVLDEIRFTPPKIVADPK